MGSSSVKGWRAEAMEERRDSRWDWCVRRVEQVSWKVEVWAWTVRKEVWRVERRERAVSVVVRRELQVVRWDWRVERNSLGVC